MSWPIFTAHEGKVFRRGIYLFEPSKLLAVFLETAERGDRFAAELATELQDAISEAESYRDKREAA